MAGVRKPTDAQRALLGVAAENEGRVMDASEMLCICSDRAWAAVQNREQPVYVMRTSLDACLDAGWLESVHGYMYIRITEAGKAAVEEAGAVRAEEARPRILAFLGERAKAPANQGRWAATLVIATTLGLNHESALRWLRDLEHEGRVECCRLFIPGVPCLWALAGAISDSTKRSSWFM